MVITGMSQIQLFFAVVNHRLHFYFLVSKMIDIVGRTYLDGITKLTGSGSRTHAVDECGCFERLPSIIRPPAVVFAGVFAVEKHRVAGSVTVQLL